MNKIFKIFLSIFSFIILIAVFFTLFSLIQMKVMKKDYTEFFGYTFFEVASGSMANTIEVYDFIIVKLTDKVEVNDIITYKLDNEYVTHRLIRKKGDYYITKGDYNKNEDNPIKKDLILGKVVKIIKKAGIWKSIILSPKVIFLIILTLITFSIFISLPDDRYKRKKKDKVKGDLYEKK